MRYKVGDRVKYVKKIINHNVVTGGIFTITHIDENNQSFQYLAESKKENKQWFKEEEIQKVEYTYEDLIKSPIGTKVFFESNNVLLKINENHYEDEKFYRSNKSLKGLKDNVGSCLLGKIIKIEEPIYKTVYENKEILDDIEKEYLRNIIKPFRDKVVFISKVTCEDEECISIIMRPEYDSFSLPYFKKGTMYKGMNKRRDYSLKELGL